jgi:hypothetical protein
MDLVDHHCHSVVRDDLDRAAFEELLTESDRPDGRAFESPVGSAVRRWCAPVLDLPKHAPAAEYLARRMELGTAEVTRRLLRSSGLSELLVDTGFAADRLLDLPELSATGDAPVREVIRLEALAESITGDFPAEFRAALARQRPVAWKSIAAYRYGLDLDPRRPDDSEVAAAWVPGRRIEDPVILRFLLWSAADTGLPIQVHCGFGDPDETLHRADPAVLQPFLHEIGTPVVLLHCYPYHRQAAYLAHVYPHVYFDTGLAVNYLGASAKTVLAEAMELAPYHKLLYSSDAFGLPEFYFLGATLFRRALRQILDSWVAGEDISAPDAARIADQIGAGNARALYGLSAD